VIKIGILFNPSKKEAKNRAGDLSKELGFLGFEVEQKETDIDSLQKKTLSPNTELVIVLGGDGTFLAAVKQVLKEEIPLLGINFGRLGFLSELADLEMKEIAYKIKNQEYKIEKRSTLEAFIPDLNLRLYALNEISLNRSHHHNLLFTNLFIGDTLIQSFRSDGIIVCTPTGSTAYALSAGGAVMDPNIKALQIVPIAAHSLASRAQVIADDQTIILKNADNFSYFLHADGQSPIKMNPRSEVVIKKSPYLLKLIRLSHKDLNFYSILRDKMKWGT
jgi:NAD+ kinase